MSEKEKELPIKKKRFSKIACIPCRGNHLKCNGVHPCQPCQKKGITCEYAQPKKRGPKTNELQILKAQLLRECDELSEKIEQLKEEQEKKQKELQDKKDSDDNDKQITLFSSNGARSLELDSIFKYFHSNYFEYFHPQLEIVEKNIMENLDRRQVMKLLKDPKSLDSKLTYLQVNVMLALSALYMGDHQDAHQFVEEARKQLSTVFDENHFKIAQCYSLLAHYMYSKGFVTKAYSYAYFARRVCKNLDMYDNWAYKLASISVGLNTQDPEERDMLLEVVLSFNNISTRDLSFYLFAKVWGDILLNKNFLNFIPLMDLIKDTEQRIFNTRDFQHEGVLAVDLIFTYFGKMLLFQATCLHDAALYWADEIVRLILINQNKLLMLPVVLVHTIVVRLHLLLNRTDKIPNDLLCLEKLSTVFPYARSILQILSSEFNISISQPIPSDLLAAIKPANYEPLPPSPIDERKLLSVIQFQQYFGITHDKIQPWEIEVILKQQEEQLRIVRQFAPNFASMTKEERMSVDSSRHCHFFPMFVKQETDFVSQNMYCNSSNDIYNDQLKTKPVDEKIIFDNFNNNSIINSMITNNINNNNNNNINNINNINNNINNNNNNSPPFNTNNNNNNNSPPDNINVTNNNINNFCSNNNNQNYHNKNNNYNENIPIDSQQQPFTRRAEQYNYNNLNVNINMNFNTGNLHTSNHELLSSFNNNNNNLLQHNNYKNISPPVIYPFPINYQHHNFNPPLQTSSRISEIETQNDNNKIINNINENTNINVLIPNNFHSNIMQSNTNYNVINTNMPHLHTNITPTINPTNLNTNNYNINTNPNLNTNIPSNLHNINQKLPNNISLNNNINNTNLNTISNLHEVNNFPQHLGHFGQSFGDPVNSNSPIIKDNYRTM